MVVLVVLAGSLFKVDETEQAIVTQLGKFIREVDGKTIYDPIYHAAYTCPGDPPGTMGVDWRGPVHVPSKTIPKWRRTCDLCGKIEETQRTNDVVTKEPKW